MGRSIEEPDLEQLLSIAIFLVLGVVCVLGGLIASALLRPSNPHPEKDAIYECGEPTIGTSWVQFDLRFYIVALFYLVFDVEVVLIYPWAVIFRDFPLEALALGLPFIGILVVGYVYEWHTGSLDWVRSAVTSSIKGAGAQADLQSLARRDPETLADQPMPARSSSGS